MPPKLVALGGSLSKASLNRTLLALAADRARALGADVDVVDLRALKIPAYDHDVETIARPDDVTALRERIRAANGLIFASPEYNVSVPGTLKNVVDWISRPPDQPLRGRTALLLAASTGVGGGRSVLFEWRRIFSVLGMIVAPSTVGVARSADAFDEQGALKDATTGKQLDAAVAAFVELTRKLA